MVNKLSPALFVLILFCFFLPFLNVSCSGQKAMTLTGLQLVTGTTIEKPGMFGEKQTQKLDGEILAGLAGIAAISGLLYGLAKDKASNTDKHSSVITSIIGIIGIVSLLLLKAKLDNDILKQGQGMIQIEYAFGFWLVLILNAVVVVINLFLFTEAKKDKDI